MSACDPCVRTRRHAARVCALARASASSPPRTPSSRLGARASAAKQKLLTPRNKSAQARSLKALVSAVVFERGAEKRWSAAKRCPTLGAGPQSDSKRLLSARKRNAAQVSETMRRASDSERAAATGKGKNAAHALRVAALSRGDAAGTYLVTVAWSLQHITAKAHCLEHLSTHQYNEKCIQQPYNLLDLKLDLSMKMINCVSIHSQSLLSRIFLHAHF